MKRQIIRFGSEKLQKRRENMKKIIIAALLCLFMLSLFGCGAATLTVHDDGRARTEQVSRTDFSARAMHGKPLSGEPSYIRFYTPLSPMPLEWYGKYRLLTDFQAF